MTSSSSEWTLPANARPTRYALILEPDLDSFTFSGSETVGIEVAEGTNEITLNSAEIEIQSAALTLASGAVSPRIGNLV